MFLNNLWIIGILGFFGVGTLSTHSLAGVSGARGATFLKRGMGPRAGAMGSAQTAVTNNSYSSYWNSAGLTQVNQREMAMMVERGMQGINHQNLALAIPWNSKMVLGAFAIRQSVKEFTSYDGVGNMTGGVDSSDAAYGLALGLKFGKYFNLGTGLKWIHSTLGPVESSTYAFDFGSLIVMPLLFNNVVPHHFKIGFAAKELGPALVYDSVKTKLPQNFRLGVGYETPDADQQLVAALDYNFSPDHKSYYTLGQEFWIKKVLALRAGYRFGEESESGIRMGMGLAVKKVMLSYSMVPAGLLGNSHHFGIIYHWPASIGVFNVPKSQDFPNTKTLSPPISMDSHEVSTSNVVVPPVIHPSPRNQVKPALKKKPNNRPKKQQTQKPFNEVDLPDNVPTLMAIGNKYLQEDRFKEATIVFGKILKMEPNNEGALELMRKALNEFDRQKKREKGIYE